MKTLTLADELLLSDTTMDGRTDRQTDRHLLIFNFCNLFLTLIKHEFSREIFTHISR